MSKIRGRIKVLTDEEVRMIHEAALDVLRTVGMKIYHDEARNYLRKAGCTVDEENKIVKFPPDIVENSVKKLRKDFLRPERQGLMQGFRYSHENYYKRDEEIYYDFTTSAGGFLIKIYDTEGNRRPATMKDVHDSIKLINGLDEITHSGLPCSDQSTRPSMRPIAMTAEMVKYTKKLGGFEAWTIDDIKYIEEIAIVVRGSKEELLKNPCLVGYGETRTPLSFDKDSAAIFMEYIKRGFPQSLDCMPAAGTTAPATSAATLMIGFAEVLIGLVLGYAIDENAILSMDHTGGFSDMKSLLFCYAGADRLPLLGARIQLLRDFYGITSGVHSCKSNANEPGFQSALEKTASTIFPLLCGAAGIGTIGQIEYGLTYSPTQLVLDAEICRYTRRILRGFEVNEETLALDVIKRVGPEGSFITDLHTYDNFKKEFWLSDLMETITWDNYKGKEIRGMENLAREKAREIMSKPLEPVLDDDQIKEIDRIVANADKHITYEGANPYL